MNNFVLAKCPQMRILNFNTISIIQIGPFILSKINNKKNGSLLIINNEPFLKKVEPFYESILTSLVLVDLFIKRYQKCSSQYINCRLILYSTYSILYSYRVQTLSFQFRLFLRTVSCNMGIDVV